MSGDELNPQVVLTADVSGYQQNIRAAEQSTNSLLDSTVRLIDTLGRLNNSAGRNIQLVGAGTTAGLVGATAAAARFQSQMQQLEATSVLTGRSLDVTTRQVNELRGGLAISTSEAVGLVTQLNKMGQGARPVSEMSREFVKLSAVTGESLPALTQSMVTLQRQMGTEGLQNTRRYTATVAALSQQAGVAAGGITEFANAIAPVSQMAGMGMREVLGFSTAFNKAGADGFAATNAYSKMVNDISRAIQFGGPQLQGYSNLLGVSVDQLRQMPVAESVTQIFEAITREGPRAQKILEQFGLDGLRSYRAIAAVSRSGDIRGNMRIAGEDSMESFSEAADKALSGLNDELGIFSNNLTRIGQSIGATFLPGAEAMLKVINGLAGGAADLTQNLGNVPGALMAAGAVGALGLGTAVRGAGLIAGAAGVQMFRRSAFRAGMINSGVPGEQLSSASGWAGQFGRNMERGDPRIGPFQRATYGMGLRVGQMRGSLPDEITQGRQGFLPAAGRVAQFGAAQTIHGAGYLIRQPFQALFPDRYSDIANRDQIMGGRHWGGSQRSWASQQMVQGRTEAAWAQGTMRNLGREFSDIARGTRELNTEQRRYSTVLRAMTTEVGRYAGGVTRAGVGATAMAGRGLAGVGGAIGGAIGSTVGWGTIGLVGAIGGVTAFQQGRRELSELRTSSEDTSGAAQYESALGLASRATMSFADAVNQARGEIIGGSPSEGLASRDLTREDLTRATDPNYQYTNPAIQGMSRADLARWVSVNRVSMDPAAIGAAKYDVLNRVGNLDQVNEMFSSAAPDVAGRWGNAGRVQGWQGRLLGFTNDDLGAEYQQLRSESERLLGVAPRDRLDDAKFGVMNQQLIGLRDSAGGDRWWKDLPIISNVDALRGNRARRNTGIEAIANSLDIYEDEDVRALKAAYRKASGESDNARFQEVLWNELAKSDTGLGRQAQEAISQGGMGSISLTGIQQSAMQDPYRFWGASEAVRDRMQNTRLGSRLMPEVPSSILGVPTEALESTRWRGENADLRREMSDAISRYAENPDEPWLQERAAWSLGENSTELFGGFREAQTALIGFRDSIRDVNDPLYQLAQAAINVSRMLEDRALNNAPESERARSVYNRWQAAERRYLNDPTNIDAARERQEGLQAQIAQEEQLRARSIGIIRAGREMDISERQTWEDYERSKGYSDFDFNLGRERAGEDFTRSRRLQEEGRERQLSRTHRDYNISRERSEYEFNLSRSRQDDSYNRQLSRTWRDYNISRQRAEYEFNLSRERQVDSYNRQLSRTWRDFNIQRERGEYEFNLSRSRQLEDFNIQRTRAEDDFRRQQARGYEDYTLSRRRQEEDFNHQLVLMAEQSARQIYNIYERVAVARTLSGENLVRNLADQMERLQEQQENLARARQMGLGDAAIRMLGLHEAGGAQQLERLLAELTPEMVRRLNEQVGQRTGLADDLMRDPANTQFAEMMRQYELQRQRGAEDFQKSMDRAREDFRRGMNNMREDFVRGLERADADFRRARRQQVEDFNRGLRDQRTEFDIALQQSADDFSRSRRQQHRDFMRSLGDQRTEFNISMAQSAEDFARSRKQQQNDFMRSLRDQQTEYDIQRAEQMTQFNTNQNRQLSDYNRAAERAEEQIRIVQKRMRDSFNRSHEEITGDLVKLWAGAQNVLSGNARQSLTDMGNAMGLQTEEVGKHVGGLVNAVKKLFDKLGINSITIKSANSGGSDKTRNSALAEGGPVPGVSAHKKADDIPIWATAGEFMQPVDTVDYYGVDVMEKMRRREIPKDRFQGYANGGYIDGRRLANPALQPTLVNYGRELQSRGFQVGEHPLFGGVHPTAHAPTSRGGLHYIGHALDINYDGRGQSVENRMLDNILKEVERLGFGYIWRSANHYSHMHIDTAARRQLNGRTTYNGNPMANGIGSGMSLDSVVDPRTGNRYLKEIYDTLGKDAGFKWFEEFMDLQRPTRDRYINRGLQRGVAMLGYQELLDSMDTVGESNEPFTVPGGVERWRPLVERALRHMGQSGSLADITLRRMNQESSGNPRAINNWDINAKNGTPSKGLMQVIDPTFRAYAMPGYKTDIWDPMSNVLASMNYALNRYGGLYKAYSRAGGYADGGLIDWHGEGAIFTGPTKIGVGERGPEMVLPLYGRGVEFLNEILVKSRQQDHRETFVRRDGVPEVSKQIVYNSSYDHSTHYTGDINVVSSDPDEMHRKLQAKRRQEALIGRRPR